MERFVFRWGREISTVNISAAMVEIKKEQADQKLKRQTPGMFPIIKNALKEKSYVKVCLEF